MKTYFANSRESPKTQHDSQTHSLPGNIPGKFPGVPGNTIKFPGIQKQSRCTRFHNKIVCFESYDVTPIMIKNAYFDAFGPLPSIYIYKAEIDHDYLRRTSDSGTRRLKACVQAGGSTIEYLL
uniref:Uncharacterized protein n=1 Tax=Caenorhabditis japonica TaxID=281687 RepID=A0A8R1EPV0_CAEJA